MIKRTDIHLFFDITTSSNRQAKMLARCITPHIGGILIPCTDRDEIEDMRNCAICGSSLYFEGTYTSYCFNDDIFLSLLDHWDELCDHRLQSMKLLVHQLTHIPGDMSYYACYEYNRPYKRLRCSYLYHDNEESEGDSWMYEGRHTDKSMTERLLKEQGKERTIDLTDAAYWAYDDDSGSWHRELQKKLGLTTKD